MKDGNERKSANDRMSPEQQQGEEFGSIKKRQLTKHNMDRDTDTARGSEPERLGQSRNRT